ncbi:uncharacterized protein M6B38_114220 [Iris pallida]|uniref:Uncharacterized protein n=1 Tax=Iris pallida TaxID=29817 RepID=A0AAX6ILC9_IRIPA|nr:uncharacterized protein M6B38_114220 [Iris pallida]
MVKLSSDSLFGLMRGRRGSKKKKTNLFSLSSSPSVEATAEKKKKSPTIGVLAFEVARLMSRAVNLWNSLSDPQISHLRDETLCLQGIRKLVSDDDGFLLGLALTETTESLGSLVRSVTSLGRLRCTDPVLQRFDHVFAHLIKNGTDIYGLQYAGRKIERKVKKMERLLAATSNLHQELEVLAELEQTFRRMQSNSNFRRKVLSQRKEVKRLRQTSLWNRSYDYAVRLLARSLFTIVGRMNHVFGIFHTKGEGEAADALLDEPANLLPRCYSFAGGTTVRPSDSDGGGSSRLTRFASGPLSSRRIDTDILARDGSSPLPPTWKHRNSWRRNKWSVSSPSFSGCIVGGAELPVTHGCSMSTDGGSPRSNPASRIPNGKKHTRPPPPPPPPPAAAAAAAFRLKGNIFDDRNLSQALFEPSSTLLNAPPPSTLGAAALALHYANVIILIEKLLQSSHLIGADARDDLYNMLPTSIRASLRARLKSIAKKLSSSVYDPILAAEWREAVARILDWLSPLAHNMIKWQSDRNFEQQLLVSSKNVLLLQTLYFSHQAKTEAAITELLVGLNYLWRFGEELNAMATSECVSSRNFDDCLDLIG